MNNTAGADRIELDTWMGREYRPSDKALHPPDPQRFSSKLCWVSRKVYRKPRCRDVGYIAASRNSANAVTAPAPWRSSDPREAAPVNTGDTPSGIPLGAVGTRDPLWDGWRCKVDEARTPPVPRITGRLEDEWLGGTTAVEVVTAVDTRAVGAV